MGKNDVYTAGAQFCTYPKEVETSEQQLWDIMRVVQILQTESY
jgi:hypothetical protein